MLPTKNRVVLIIFIVFLLLDCACSFDNPSNEAIERCLSDIAASFRINNGDVTKDICVKRAICNLKGTNGFVGAGVEYYRDLKLSLGPGNIRTPIDFCLHEINKDQELHIFFDDTPDEDKCWEQLNNFPPTSDEALQHVLSIIDMESLLEDKDYVVAYLIHMVKSFEFKNNLLEPQNYCQNIVNREVLDDSGPSE